MMFCGSAYTLKHFKRIMERRDLLGGEESVDIIFFDATYEENGESTLTLLEKLIKKNPRFKDISIVLLGKDVAANRINDYRIEEIVSRVEELPYRLYGDRNGTKTEVMISTIKQMAEKKGLNIPKKMFPGLIREEVLEKVAGYNTLKCAMLDVLKQLSSSANDIKQLSPENESERVITQLIGQDYYTLITMAHAIGQTNMGMSSVLYLDKRRREEQKNKGGTIEVPEDPEL